MLAALARRGLRRGFVDGSKPWMIIGVASVALRLLKALNGPDEKVLFREKLKPGESLLVSRSAVEED